jgi:shikimate kinase
MPVKTNIILVGLSGSGKSTIGKLLSTHLNWQLLDTDTIIETEAKMAIRELFAQYGESYFRDLEHKLARRLRDENSDKQVIATGGGMPIYNNNLAILKELGKVFYLKADIDVITSRLVAQNQGLATRPLLIQNNQAENEMLSARQSLSKILDERRAFYQEADIILETDELSPKEIQEQIMTILESEGMV